MDRYMRPPLCSYLRRELEHIKKHCRSLRCLTLPYQCATAQHHERYYTELVDGLTPVGKGKRVLYDRQTDTRTQARQYTIHLEEEVVISLWQHLDTWPRVPWKQAMEAVEAVDVEKHDSTMVVRKVVFAMIAGVEVLQSGRHGELDPASLHCVLPTHMDDYMDLVWYNRPREVHIPVFRDISAQDDPRTLQWANWTLATIDTRTRDYLMWAP